MRFYPSLSGGPSTERIPEPKNPPAVYPPGDFAARLYVHIGAEHQGKRNAQGLCNFRGGFNVAGMFAAFNTAYHLHIQIGIFRKLFLADMLQGSELPNPQPEKYGEIVRVDFPFRVYL